MDIVFSLPLSILIVMNYRKPFTVSKSQIELLGALFNKYYPQTMDKMYAVGAYLTMGDEGLWRILIRCICAAGRSAPSYELIGSPDIEKLSIRSMRAFKTKNGNEELIKYTHGILAAHGVRYCSPKKETSQKAVAIVNNFNDPMIVDGKNFVLIKNMEKQKGITDPRDFLMDNVYNFGIKLSSQFLIETGYSRDYMSFDSRLKRIFTKIFYKDFMKLCETKEGYLQAEKIIREDVCAPLKIKVTELDSVLFWNYGSLIKDIP
jgi:thermostable 8-oxoguanine DNA glycosylase